MKKGNITIPINEVWELLDKPHRFFRILAEEVEKLPTGDYLLLGFDSDTKAELIKKIKSYRI